MNLAPSQRPNHKYFVNLVMPYDYIWGKWLVAKVHHSSKNAKWIYNRNYHTPGGTKLFLRLLFPIVLPSKHCFNAADSIVPINKIQLENEASAYINHKWTKLNAAISPSKIGVKIPRNKVATLKIAQRALDNSAPKQTQIIFWCTIKDPSPREI